MESPDLNLLRTFVLVCKSNSLKRAGLKLGISESAVSKQLAKLRGQLDQPLFERTTEGLKPTHYSRTILPEVERALAMLGAAVSPEKFEPATYTGPISLAFFAYSLEFSGEAIFERLKAEFPMAQFELKTWTSDTEQMICDGEITLGMHLLNEERSADIFQKRIMADKLVIATSSAMGQLSWEEAIKLPFIKIRSLGWNEERYRYLEILNQNKIDLEISVTVDNCSLARQILKQGKHACVLSDCWNDPSLNTIVPPEHLQLHLYLVTCTRLVDRHSPLHRALHQVIKDVMIATARRNTRRS